MNCKLMKPLLLILISLPYSALWAQKRICDLEAVCISPADTVVNGKFLPLRYGRKNLGPDVMMNNDTTFVTLYKIVDGNKELIYGGAFGEFGVERDTVNIGESTIYRARNSFINFIYENRPEPFIVEFCVQLDSWKTNSRGDTVGFGYYDSVVENNTCCKQVVVMPAKTTSVMDVNVEEYDFTLYPNPVNAMLFVKTKSSLIPDDVKVSVQDLAGRTMYEKLYTPVNTHYDAIPVSVEGLSPGVYTISLLTDKASWTRKFAVSR